MLRFANVIHVRKEREEEIWDTIVKIKNDMTFHENCRQVLYTEDVIENNVAKIENLLNIELSLTKHNMTCREMTIAAEMFIYLNTCPKAEWLLFYRDLFKYHSPDYIILTLNRVMKSSSKKYKDIAWKLLERFDILLPLAYSEIHFINSINSNGSFPNNYDDVRTLFVLQTKRRDLPVRNTSVY